MFATSRPSRHQSPPSSSRPSFTSITHALVFSFLLALESTAAPQPGPSGQSMQLGRRSPVRTAEQWGKWAQSSKDFLVGKWSDSVVPEEEDTAADPSSAQKRSAGTNLIVNQNGDTSYYGSLAIGSPPVAFNVILDTGSSDLWIVNGSCTSGCTALPKFVATESDTFKNLASSFVVTYGSGRVSGNLVQDTVQMAGFSVSQQSFGLVNNVSEGLLNRPVTGLMGLAFQPIASSGAVPFWQSLAEGGAWDEPVMTFQLTRFQNVNNAQSLEPGGTFTMGFINQSLYTGDIEYYNLINTQPSYWNLGLTEVDVDGNTVSIPSGSSSSSAAIDTGTTLIGGPADQVSEIYAQIPGSTPGTGAYDGYYLYPCNANVSISLSFGGQNWPISLEDFRLTQLTQSMCLGAIFEVDLKGTNPPAWIIGDTFLKNVYTVFRYSPPSVGFAALSPLAAGMSNIDNPIPTPTLGSISAQVTALTSDTNRASSGVVPSFGTPTQTFVLSLLLFVAFLYVS